MNAEGRLFYQRPWTHTIITQLLANPAYVGDTHFGKTQTGDMHTFDKDGLMVNLKKATGKTQTREVVDRIVRHDTHEGLIDRKTWVAAQAKLKAEKSRTSYAPRNPTYYLKTLFVCGHCGKNLTGRTEIDRATKKRTVVYVCQSWMQGRGNGQETSCGYQRITHAHAEQLLLEKIKELNFEFDAVASEGARSNIKAQLSSLEHADDATVEQWDKWVEDGICGLLEYLKDAFGLSPDALRPLKKVARKFYGWNSVRAEALEGLPLAVADFRQAVRAAEELAVARAHEQLAEIKDEHICMTKAWAKASELQRDVLKDECARLEGEIELWKERTTPLAQRLKRLRKDDDARRMERDKLIADWPTLENREMGQALRRIFHTVTLFWDREFKLASATPTRPRKTERLGRWKYTLLKDRIVWNLTVTGLGGSR